MRRMILSVVAMMFVACSCACAEPFTHEEVLASGTGTTTIDFDATIAYADVLATGADVTVQFLNAAGAVVYPRADSPKAVFTVKAGFPKLYPGLGLCTQVRIVRATAAAVVVTIAANRDQP